MFFAFMFIFTFMMFRPNIQLFFACIPFFCFFTVYEIIYFIMGPRNYLKDYENWIEIISTSLGIANMLVTYMKVENILWIDALRVFSLLFFFSKFISCFKFLNFLRPIVIMISIVTYKVCDLLILIGFFIFGVGTITALAMQTDMLSGI